MKIDLIKIDGMFYPLLISFFAGGFVGLVIRSQMVYIDKINERHMVYHEAVGAGVGKWNIDTNSPITGPAITHFQWITNNNSTCEDK